MIEIAIISTSDIVAFNFLDGFFKKGLDLVGPHHRIGKFELHGITDLKVEVVLVDVEVASQEHFFSSHVGSLRDGDGQIDDRLDCLSGVGGQNQGEELVGSAHLDIGDQLAQLLHYVEVLQRFKIARDMALVDSFLQLLNSFPMVVGLN